MAILDDSWKIWIWKNIADGCSKDQIFKILHDNGVSYDDIVREIAHEPSMPLAEIENPFPVAPFETEAGAENAASQFTMTKLAPYLWGMSNVLTEDQCAVLIEAAKPHLRPSTVVVDLNAYGEKGSGIGDTRRGESASIDPRQELAPELAPVVEHLTDLVAELTQLPVSHQEPLHVLHYGESDFFSLHHDAFGLGSEYLKWEGERGGQRLFSFMVWLNEVEEGGEIEFPHANVKLSVGPGKAGFWYNLLDGQVYRETHHIAHPVTRGEKWALVIWVREAPFGHPTPERGAARRLDQARYVEWISAKPSLEQPEWISEQVREQQARVPFLAVGGDSCRGIEKRPLDASIYSAITEHYESIKSQLVPETDASVGTFVHSVSLGSPVSLYREDQAFNQKILDLMKSTHEEWCGFELEPAACYGYRVYLQGAYLYPHLDRYTTHVVSSSICVAQDVYSPWLFEAIDADGSRVELDVEPGEFILYESARLEHGRPIPLHGRYQVGLFLHYRPAHDWEGWIESPLEWWQREQERRAKSDLN